VAVVATVILVVVFLVDLVAVVRLLQPAVLKHQVKEALAAQVEHLRQTIILQPAVVVARLQQARLEYLL
jgi:uncharacterized membrane protein affecting hemolysin expression